MHRVCQGGYGLFALALAVSLAATGVCAEGLPAKLDGDSISVHLRSWSPTPFADVVLDNPDLAACFLLAQGWWASAAPLQTSPREADLEKAIAAQLEGVSQLTSLTDLAIYLAGSERNAATAVGHGDTILVLAPKGDGGTVTELAPAIATARLLATYQSAPPDPRCGEPLLTLGEAIAKAGTLALAELPPSLRPVKSWVEAKEVLPALTALVNESLDADASWLQRKARLAAMGQFGGAGPRIANAAALVVEAFGDSPRARHSPLDLLLAWQAHTNKDFPSLPHGLHRALAKPLEAGLPKGESERAAIAADALARRVANGTAQLGDIGKDVPQPLRFQLAASARAIGNAGLCAWLTGTPFTAMRTGCRSEGEEGGIVFARPRMGAGFDVVWRSAGGDEAPLLSWPRWLLFPAVIASRGELCFIDAQGLWRLPLDAHAAPRLALRGTFRYLAVSPDGAAIAVAHWPGGQVAIVRDSGPVEPAINGKGGLVWLEPDLLLAADGEKLNLVSLKGEVRAGILPLPCCDSLVAGKAGITAGLNRPCEPGLVRVVLPERRAVPLVKLTEPPIGIAVLPQGDVVFGSVEGLWRWRGQGEPVRIGSGLTPGPG
jgi:hypothetical protein